MYKCTHPISRKSWTVSASDYERMRNDVSLSGLIWEQVLPPAKIEPAQIITVLPPEGRKKAKKRTK